MAKKEGSSLCLSLSTLNGCSISVIFVFQEPAVSFTHRPEIFIDFASSAIPTATLVGSLFPRRDFHGLLVGDRWPRRKHATLSRFSMKKNRHES